MKKILFLGLILTLVFSVSASAQVTDGKRSHPQNEMRSFRHGDLNRYESRRFHHDEFRHKMARRRAYHEGRMSHYERRHFYKMRRHERHELHRFHHDRYRHVI
jgi:Ni/Co efflux regulator RcnB